MVLDEGYRDSLCSLAPLLCKDAGSPQAALACQEGACMQQLHAGRSAVQSLSYRGPFSSRLR